jgi:putative oxidoreductase
MGCAPNNPAFKILSDLTSSDRKRDDSAEQRSVDISQVYYMPIIIFIARIVLGAIFIASGVSKQRDTDAFYTSIMTFDLVPASVATMMSVTIPLAEFCIGTLLIFGFATRIMAWLLVAMIAIFSLALASTLTRRFSVSCGCFGPAKIATNVPKALARNALLLALVGFVIIHS